MKQLLLYLGLLFGMIVACFALKYWVWRLKHPEAPIWTFFF